MFLPGREIRQGKQGLLDMAHHALLNDKIDSAPRYKRPLEGSKPFEWIALASLVIMLIIFIYTGYFTRDFAVSVSKVSQEYPYQVYTKFSADGKIVVEHKISIAPRVAGQISEIMVDKGSLVKKDQVIARLDSTDASLLRDQRKADLRLAEAKLEQARIGLNEAKLEYEHCVDQYRKGSVSGSGFHACAASLRRIKSAFEVAQATVIAQTAALHSANAGLVYTEVRAPFDGIVLSRDAHVGDTAGPKLTTSDDDSGIVTLADLSSLEIEVQAPASEIESLKAGQPCMVSVDALKLHLKGKVESVMQTAGKDNMSASVLVRLIDHDARILPEMSAQVAFLAQQVAPGEDKPLILVNRFSLTKSRSGYFVFVVKDEKAVEKRVHIGAQFKDKVEIRQGISDGDMLIVNPPDGIRNGSRVFAHRI